MLVARFFAGVGSSTYSTLVGGVISDVYRPWERNVPMAIFSGGALAGIGLGPLVCGFIGEYSSWRWVFWHQVIANALLVGCFVYFVPETRESILLSRECHRLNKWAEKLEHSDLACFDLSQVENCGYKAARRVRWTLGDTEGGGDAKFDLLSLIATSLSRPFVMLYREPIVTYLSTWATFSWSVLYIALAVIPLMFADVYGFSLSEANAIFAAACIGPILAAVICIAQDRWVERRRPMRGTQTQPPENRLYFTCVESFLLPAGLFMFGWTARADIHWIVPAIAIGIATSGIFSIYLSVFNYLSDSYRSFASSALAAQSACRNIVGGVLPLVTTQLYTGLGYGPGSSLLGGIAVLLCMGSWILVLHGDFLRGKSPFAQVLAKSG